MRRVNFSLLLGTVIAGLACLILLSPKTTFAATRTWDGGGTTNNWSEDANWSSDTKPVAADTATFDGTSTKNATIDQAFTIASLNINTGYIGTITQAADLTLVSSAFTHNTSDGTFAWTSGTLSFTGTNGGWDVDTGDDTFGNVTISKNTGQNVTVTSGDTAIVTGTLTLTDGNISTGTVEARGDVVHGAGFDGGTGTLNVTQGSSSISLTDGGQLPTVNFSATRNLIGNATGTVTFDGNFSISGGAFVGGAGNLDLNGTSTTLGLSIVSPATFTAPSGTMFIAGGFSHLDASTFTHNGGTVTFDASTATIDVNTTETFNNVTWNATAGASKTVSAGDTLIVMGTLTLAEGNIVTGTVEARGDVLHGGGFDGGNGTLTITQGSSDINLTAGGQLPKTTLSATRTVNGAASGVVIFDNTLTISGGSFIGAAGEIDIASGGVTLSSPGVLTAPSGIFDVTGAWTHTDASVFDHNSGTVIFRGNATADVNGTETFNNMTLNATGGGGRTTGTNDTLIILGSLVLTDGTFSGLTATLDVRGDVTAAATFDGGIGTISFGNDAVAQVYTVNGGIVPKVLFDAPADANDSVVFVAAATMDRVTTTADFSGAIPLVNAGNSVLTIPGWSQAAGTYDASAQSSWIVSDFDISGGTFVAPTLVTSTGTGTFDWDLFTGLTLNNYTLNKSSATSINLFQGGNLVIAGNLNLTDGTFNSNALTENHLTAQGDVVVGSGFDGGTGKLIFGGSGTQTFDLTGATGLYDADLRVNKTGGQVNLISDLVLNGASQDFNIEDGAFNLNGHNLTVNGSSGTITVEDGGNFKLQGSEALTFNASNPTLQSDSTVTYTGDGDAGADTYTVTSLASTYGNLAIASTDGATDTFQLGAPVVLNGDLNLTSGTFDVTAGNHAILAHGDWNNSGAFNPRTGTVTFNGDHTLTGSTTFYNFTDTTSPATLIFPAGLTQTITGDLTLAGSSSASLLSLRSSIPGSKAKIDPQGTRTLQYLSVQDNDNDNALVATCTTGCVNSGNNENWFFATGTGGGLIYPSNLSIQAPTCSASRIAQISLTGTDVSQYLLSEDPNFIGTDWITFQPQSDKTMTVGFTLSDPDSEKTLYVKFRSSTGIQSGTYIADIQLDQAYACSGSPGLPPAGPEPITPLNTLNYISSCSDHSQLIDDNQVLLAGVALLKFSDPAVYVIENDPLNPDNRILRWLVDENTARINFGPRWDSYVLELPEITSSYIIGTPITTKEYSGTSAGLNSRAALTGNVTYEPYIVTPDGEVRFGNSDYAKITTDASGLKTYGFEDRDDFDYDDVIVQLDAVSNCLTTRLTALPLDAAMHSQIWLTVLWDGRPQTDISMFMDSHDAVTHIATTNVSNDILMDGQVQIEFKHQFITRLIRSLAVAKSLFTKLISMY